MTTPARHDVASESPAAVLVEIPTHYYQFDQQGVAFNMWYLAFLEEARNGYLAARGFSLQDLLASGHDIQMVHVDVDWRAPVRYGDRVSIYVTCTRVGDTSLRLSYDLHVNGQVGSTASVVYVIVDGAISGPVTIPKQLRAILVNQRPGT